MRLEEETKIFIDISKNLGEINSKIGQLCDTIAKHEQRITILEQKRISLKDESILLLVKGLISSILIIGSLTGSAGLISKMLGFM